MEVDLLLDLDDVLLDRLRVRATLLNREVSDIVREALAVAAGEEFLPLPADSTLVERSVLRLDLRR